MKNINNLLFLNLAVYVLFCLFAHTTALRDDSVFENTAFEDGDADNDNYDSMSELPVKRQRDNFRYIAQLGKRFNKMDPRQQSPTSAEEDAYLQSLLAKVIARMEKDKLEQTSVRSGNAQKKLKDPFRFMGQLGKK